MTRSLRFASLFAVVLSLVWCGVAGAQNQFNTSTMGLRNWIKSHYSPVHGTEGLAGASMAHAIHIDNDSPLDFGLVLASHNPGTVVIPPTGTIFTTGGAGLGSGGRGPAVFTVTGDPGESYSILLPDAIELHNGPYRMVIDQIISSPSGTGHLDINGRETLRVGGTLNVAGDQAQGEYQRVFHVTVAYD